MLLKKNIAIVAAASALALTLSACGGPAAPSQGPASAPAGNQSTGELKNTGTTIWILSGGATEAILVSSLEQWNTKYPDNKIEYQTMANDDFKNKIQTAVGAKNAPTLIYGWGATGTVMDYIKNDKIIDLTGKIPDLEARVIPSVIDAGKIDGKIWAAPATQSQPVILYYNKDLFTQAGVTAPIATWDDLIASIPKFKAINVAPFALAGASKWPDLMWIEMLTDRIGGPQPFINVVANKPDAWSDPAFAQALTKIQDLVKAGGIVDSFGTIVADANADVALVHSGKAAMLLQGSWSYGSFKQDAPDFVSAGKLGAFQFPTVAGGAGDPKNIAGNPCNYLSVSADATADQQATALKFLNEMVENEAAVKALVDAGGVPPTKDAKAVMDASADKAFFDIAFPMIEEAPSFQLSWDQAISPVQAQELLTNLDKIFMLQITPDEFVANMNKVIGK